VTKKHYFDKYLKVGVTARLDLVVNCSEPLSKKNTTFSDKNFPKLKI